MPQVKATKHYHTFVGGLHTEVTPLTHPEGSMVDVANFKLGIDGSLRRRKGLAPETAAELNLAQSTYANGTDAVTSHFWRNTGGLDSHFQIVQVGAYLYFFDDDEDTLTKRDDSIKLTNYKVAGSTTTEAAIAAEPVDISWGRGQALVTQKYLDPFVLTFNPVTNLVTTSTVRIRVRDFVGVEDGQAAATTPSTLEDIHRYNLLNSGWSDGDITAYQATNTTYPARTQVWYNAYTRVETSGGTMDDRGVAAFSAARAAAEPVGISSSQRGRLLQDPFNTTASGGSGEVEITTWDTAITGGYNPITITTASAHGYSAGETVSIAGLTYCARFTENDPEYGTISWDVEGDLDGIHIITATTSTTFEINWEIVEEPFTWIDQYKTLGSAAVGVVNPNGSKTDLRPTTNAYFAGRAWYAGTPALELGQRILFSQIIQRDEQYSRCYQANDPTSPTFPDLTEADGGDLYIPEAGRVIKLQPFGPSMLVMCENGIWEIDGGGNRYFDAIDYSVRRVSQVGCIARESVIEADQTIVFASEQGAFRIFVDPRARVLVTEPITSDKVNRKWVNIPLNHMKAMISFYDPVEKRIFWFYDTSANPTAPTYNYTEALIYDMRLDAFSVYTIPAGTDFTTNTWVKTVVKPASYVRDGLAIMKILSYNEDNELVWNELTDTSFEDFGELDAAGFITTGFESMGDASSDKQISHFTTFMERIDDSSLKLRGRWDFANSSITGKMSPEIECYKPPRATLTDSGTSDDDGYPVVFTKHTMPGQGLVIQFRFSTTPGADCNLYGWSVDFQGIK